MAIHNEMGILLYIWRNKGFFRTLAGSFGHAALRLVGPHFQKGNQKSVYISWWPGMDQSHWSLGAIQLRTAEHQHHRAYWHDKRAELSDRAQQQLRNGSPLREGQRSEDPSLPLHMQTFVKLPDIKISLPTLGAKGVVRGLDARRIHAWWKVINGAATGPWTTIRRNCAKIVAAALEAGGAADIVPMPRTTLWRPTVVEKWAQAIVSRCAESNQWTQWIQPWDLQTLSREESPTSAVWDVATWKRESSGGKRHVRSAAFRKIDHYLAKYHAFKPPAEGPRPEADRSLPLLGDILDAIHEDLILHPKFHRKNPAALMLGKQCLDELVRVTQTEPEFEDVPPPPTSALAQTDFETYDENALA